MFHRPAFLDLASGLAVLVKEEAERIMQQGLDLVDLYAGAVTVAIDAVAAGDDPTKKPVVLSAAEARLLGVEPDDLAEELWRLRVKGIGRLPEGLRFAQYVSHFAWRPNGGPGGLRTLPTLKAGEQPPAGCRIVSVSFMPRTVDRIGLFAWGLARGFKAQLSQTCFRGVQSGKDAAVQTQGLGAALMKADLQVWAKERKAEIAEWPRTQAKGGDSPEQERKHRIEIEPEAVVLDGVRHTVTEEGARILEMLWKAKGGRILGSALQSSLTLGERPDRIIKGLPEPVRQLIESKRGRGGGFRLKVESIAMDVEPAD